MQPADFHVAYGVVTVLETCIALCYSVRYTAYYGEQLQDLD